MFTSPHVISCEQRYASCIVYSGLITFCEFSGFLLVRDHHRQDLHFLLGCGHWFLSFCCWFLLTNFGLLYIFFCAWNVSRLATAECSGEIRLTGSGGGSKTKTSIGCVSIWSDAAPGVFCDPPANNKWLTVISQTLIICFVFIVWRFLKMSINYIVNIYMINCPNRWTIMRTYVARILMLLGLP